MNKDHTIQPQKKRPDISFIMPCYNEESVIVYTIPRLLTAFKREDYILELILVDNGSDDRTGEIIEQFAAQNPNVVCHHVEVNEGYGKGVLDGITFCNAPWIGIIPADGQVDAEDAVRLYEAVITTNGNVLGKVRRRYRMDGLRRKIVSITYNLFFRILWPRIESLDINGSPKILPRQIILSMELKSKDWLLDPEIMVKAYHMGVRILEFNVFARMRGSGVSHVHMNTVWGFFSYLLLFKFSREWRSNFDKARLKVNELT